MAPPAPPARTPAKRPSTLVTVAVMLTIAIMGSLWVPIFARTQPQLGGFPFFYWYQLILVPVTSLLCWICYLLLRTRRAKSRQSVPSRGATPQGTQGARR
ncbi:MAG TPA: DUF3311 domain-containing protein [Streptosporangiaceae bacterium]|nr:DUF3311 domain-containing protein [Streptosporangiaceae bacterium]